MSGSEGAIIDFNACDGIIEDLNALEQATEEICGAGTIAKIKERKKKIKEAKG